MAALLATPVVLSSLVLGAHFLRGGQIVAVALCLALPGLLLLRRPWVPPVLSGALLGGAALWLATAVQIGRVRLAHGEPWLRMALILGGVALFTAASAAAPWAPRLRARFRAPAPRCT